MTTLREWRSRGSKRILYHTFEMYHSSFGYMRMIKNVSFEKRLGGNTYYPAVFNINETTQSKTPVIDTSVHFGRLGIDFKNKLKMWRGESRISPINATYRLFDSSDGSVLKSWSLFISSINISESDVSCQITLKNPLNNNVSLLYMPSEWTGLING